MTCKLHKHLPNSAYIINFIPFEKKNKDINIKYNIFLPKVYLYHICELNRKVVYKKTTAKITVVGYYNENVILNITTDY